MGKQYFVNTKAQPNGDHEVHLEHCKWMPAPANARQLGLFDNCHDAVSEAAKILPQVNGCIFCCMACHTR
jgi:hypothetical protein